MGPRIRAMPVRKSVASPGHKSGSVRTPADRSVVTFGHDAVSVQTSVDISVTAVGADAPHGATATSAGQSCELRTRAAPQAVHVCASCCEVTLLPRRGRIHVLVVV